MQSQTESQQNSKLQLVQHLKNRKMIKEMYKKMNIQTYQRDPQILSDMIEKDLKPDQKYMYGIMKNELKNKGYTDFRYVGQGIQGTVLIAKEISTKKRFAIKGVYVKDDEGKPYEKNLQEAKQEIKVLTACKGSPYVSNFIKEIEGNQFYFLVLTECQGTLKDLILGMQDNILNEITAIKYAKDIAEGLYHIHQKGYLANDLKMDNILIDFNGNAVVSDFGLAQKLQQQKEYVYDYYMGNSYFQAPECYDPKYFDEYKKEYQNRNVQIPPIKPTINSEACSLGYLIYTMIQGNRPFFVLQKNKPLKFDDNFKNFTYFKQLQQIIEGLTQFVPSERISIKEVLIILKGIISFEFNLDQRFIELIDQQTQLDSSSEQQGQVEFVECYSNKYYPIFQNESSIQIDLGNQQLIKNLETQNNILKQKQDQLTKQIAQFEAQIQELKKKQQVEQHQPKFIQPQNQMMQQNNQLLQKNVVNNLQYVK